MGSLSNGIKKFIQNKNTVTLLGLVLVVFIIWFAYSWRVRQATNPQPVPYATKQISPGTQITEDMIGTTEVPPSMLRGDVLTEYSQIIDKYSNADTVIPEGSLFYERQVVEKEQLPANIILDYPKGDVLYNLEVDSKSTYGNSIYPGNYIDIYLKINKKVQENGGDSTDAMMLGKFIENVKVLAVRDSAGRPVFADLDEGLTPSMVIFSVPQEIYILLKKAENLNFYESTIIPVPTNESLKDNPDKVKVTSDDLKAYINQITIWTE